MLSLYVRLCTSSPSFCGLNEHNINPELPPRAFAFNFYPTSTPPSPLKRRCPTAVVRMGASTKDTRVAWGGSDPPKSKPV
jgi:hypothetical protein